jgi:hypothetical protein
LEPLHPEVNRGYVVTGPVETAAGLAKTLSPAERLLGVNLEADGLQQADQVISEPAIDDDVVTVYGSGFQSLRDLHPHRLYAKDISHEALNVIINVGI